jgi:alkyl hydroperoxide reductase subunit F
MYDLIIIGAGPAGVSAGVYAARKRLKTLLIATEVGGQSTVSEDIQNWIGTPHISGSALSASFKAHLEEYKDDVLTIATNETVTALEKKDSSFSVTVDSGKVHETKTVLIASGAGRKKLTVKGADVFENKGVVYCASCDGPLFAGQDVAVIGGGNAGIETALQLSAYAKSVTIVHKNSALKADEITIQKTLALPNITALTNTSPVEVLGEKFVSGLVVENNDTKEKTTLSVTGVFVEIGVLPNTGFLKGVVEMDEYNRVIVDQRDQRTKVAGLWAAGDCTNELYHQNNIAAGDGVKALEDIYLYLKKG